MTAKVTQFPDWIYRQSGVLPYRRSPDGLQVLLITSRKRTRWVLPKGIVEPGLTAPQSAAREAREEAGVDGFVGAECLGSYRYRKWGGTCKVEVFPMEVRSESENWPEAEMRQRAWMTVPKASKRVNEKALRKIIRRLPDAVDAVEADAAAPSRRRSAAAGRPGRLIYLLRHAKSSWADPDLRDFERPLAPRGERALKKMRRYMELADVEPDVILCSSATRARQTLSALQPALGEGVATKYDRRIYSQGAQGLLNRLRQLPDNQSSVMLIGHNPGLQALALDLIAGGDEKALAQMQEKYPTGALATLVWRGRRWSEIGPATCELHSLVVPRQL